MLSAAPPNTAIILTRSSAGISTRHTLALVNRGHATFADIEALQSEIISTVQAKFNITLEREPVLLA